MKRLDLVLCLAAGLFGFGACKKQVSNNDAIRAGILQHLTAIGTLNMSAMDMDVRSVSINGNQAHAEVEFRPKTGGAPGAGMHVAYNLEKRDGKGYDNEPGGSQAGQFDRSINRQRSMP